MGDCGPGRGRGKGKRRGREGGRGAWGGSKNEKRVTTPSDGFWSYNSSEGGGGGGGTSQHKVERVSAPTVVKQEEKSK